MNAPVIMQFRPPLAASIPLRGRVAGAVRARKTTRNRIRPKSNSNPTSK